MLFPCRRNRARRWRRDVLGPDRRSVQRTRISRFASLLYSAVEWPSESLDGHHSFRSIGIRGAELRHVGSIYSILVASAPSYSRAHEIESSPPVPGKPQIDRTAHFRASVSVFIPSLCRPRWRDAAFTLVPIFHLPRNQPITPPRAHVPLAPRDILGPRTGSAPIGRRSLSRSTPGSGSARMPPQWAS